MTARPIPQESVVPIYLGIGGGLTPPGETASAAGVLTARALSATPTNDRVLLAPPAAAVPPPAVVLALALDSDNCVSVEGVARSESGALVPDAAVTLSIRDAAGAPLTTLVCAPVLDTPGTYRTVVLRSLGLGNARLYSAELRAELGAYRLVVPLRLSVRPLPGLAVA